MTVRSINAAGTTASDIAYIDENGAAQTATSTAGYTSAGAAVTAASSGDILIATEAFADSTAFDGFEAKALKLYVATSVKTDTTDTENGYRLTNITDAGSKIHTNDTVYCDVMFVKTDAGNLLQFSNSLGTSSNVSRCVIKHNATGRSFFVTAPASTGLSYTFRRNIVYRNTTAGGTDCFNIQANSAATGLTITLDNNITRQGIVGIFVKSSASSGLKLLLRNNICLDAGFADYLADGTFNGYDAAGAGNWSVDGTQTATNPAGGGGTTTTAAFAVSVNDLSRDPELADSAVLGVDLSDASTSPHNFDFAGIVPGLWSAGATDIEAAGNGGAAPVARSGLVLGTGLRL